MDNLLSIRDAAKMLAVHPNTLRNWERLGKIKSVRIGSRRDRRYELEQLVLIASINWQK